MAAGGKIGEKLRSPILRQICVQLNGGDTALGSGYLELLQFFLNHRRFMRSRRPERIGKSPKELLTNECHSHWLELLGYRLFERSGQVNITAVEEEKAA